MTGRSRRRHRGNRRKPVAILAIILVAALLVAAAYILTMSSRGAVSTESANEIRSAYAAHFKNIESQNLTAVVRGYENNASIDFKGNVSSLAGHYAGLASILVLYQSVLSPNVFGTVNLTNMSYDVNVLGGGKAIVNSTFTMHGNSTMFSTLRGGSPAPGTYTASVSSGVTYVRLGTAWLISAETWDFITFDLST
jgi:type II secretory pathway pseudopilin PulG